MKKHSITSAIRSLAILVVCLGLASFANASPLEGIWINTNPETQSSPKIEIEINKDGTATFVWWGKTNPKDSKYGPFPLKLYRELPGDRNPPRYGMAVHKTKFSDMLFTLEIDGGYLAVNMFTEFKDDSGRKPYRVHMTFMKEEASSF